MEHLAAGRIFAGAPPGEANHQRFFVHVDADYVVDLGTQPLQHLVQGFGLGHCPGKTVQDESLFAIRLGQPVFDDTDDYFIGHQCSGIHALLGLLAHFRPFFHRRPEDVAGGDLGDMELVDEFLGLRAFARAWTA